MSSRKSPIFSESAYLVEMRKKRSEEWKKNGGLEADKYNDLQKEWEDSFFEREFNRREAEKHDVGNLLGLTVKPVLTAEQWRAREKNEFKNSRRENKILESRFKNKRAFFY